MRGRLGQGLKAAWEHPRWGFLLRLVLGYVVLVEGLIQVVLGHLVRGAPIPRGVFLQGAIVGTLYALVGMGLILVYRAGRIINFAQAQLGAVPAVLGLLLLAQQRVPYLVAVLITLAGGALLGGFVEVALIRRFSNASRLVLTVVTIGLGFLLLVTEYYTKVAVQGQIQLVADFPTPFTGIEFQVGIVRFTGDHLITLAVAGVIVVTLGAFLRFTDIGIAIRAAAENGERAALLGVPVRRVATVVWILAGVLSAVGVFLRGPLIGIPLTGFVGPSILLFGLTTAVMARMERLPTALLAGMFVGVVENAALFSLRRAAFASAAMLLLILVALLTQREALSRAQEAATSSWQAVREFRPIPLELRGLPEVRIARAVFWTVVVAALLLAPLSLGAQGTTLAAQGIIYAMVGVSLVVLTGWAGQISLGQFAISGVGAAVAGGLAANYQLDFFLTLLIGGLAGSAVAVLIGLPAVRLPGLFLAVTTLAFAFTVEHFVLTREFFGWLLPRDLAFVERPRLYGRLDLATESAVGGLRIGPDAKFYYLALVFLGLVLLAGRALRRYRSGRVLIGVRDNPRVLQAFGVNPVRTRLAAFAIAGFIAALAGALLAYEQGSVDAGTYSPERSIQLFIMTVIGGIGSLSGAMLGALLVLGVPLLPGLRDVELIGFLTSGAGVLLVLALLPGGLAEGAQRIRDGFLRKVAARHGLDVPSLVADRLVTEDAPIPVAGSSGEADAALVRT